MEKNSLIIATHKACKMQKYGASLKIKREIFGLAHGKG
jgi:hypothetical protein